MMPWLLRCPLLIRLLNTKTSQQKAVIAMMGAKRRSKDLRTESSAVRSAGLPGSKSIGAHYQAARTILKLQNQKAFGAVSRVWVLFGLPSRTKGPRLLDANHSERPM